MSDIESVSESLSSQAAITKYQSAWLKNNGHLFAVLEAGKFKFKCQQWAYSGEGPFPGSQLSPSCFALKSWKGLFHKVLFQLMRAPWPWLPHSPERLYLPIPSYQACGFQPKNFGRLKHSDCGSQGDF